MSQHISGETDGGFYKGFIECPDPVKVCPTFYCPYDCLDTNNGICDYNTGLCMCGKLGSSFTNISTIITSSTSSILDSYDNITTEWFHLINEELAQPSSTTFTSITNNYNALMECNQIDFSSSQVITRTSSFVHTNTSSGEQSQYHHPEVHFFETKLSQYYVVNAEFLENDHDYYNTITNDIPEGTTYEKYYTTWRFYIAVALGISTLLAIVILSFKVVQIRKVQRERNKNKFVASLCNIIMYRWS